MIVNRTTLLLVGFVLALSISACAPLQDVPFEELVSNPERYHGRRVCTEGIYVTGFEVNALGASLRRDGEAVYLTEPVIWLEGAEIRLSTDCVDSGSFPTARFCRATVCGLFESGGYYGHVGGYAYQLGAADR
jgi:hypothetical protein